MRSYLQLYIESIFLLVTLKIVSSYFWQLVSNKNLNDNIWNFTPVTQLKEEH